MEKDMFTDGYMKLQVRKVQTDYNKQDELPSPAFGGGRRSN